METLLLRVKNLLSGLSDIQPNVSMSGLDEEALKIQAMKNNVVEMIGQLTPVHPRLESVVKACQLDAVSSYAALQSLILNTAIEKDVSDEHLEIVCLAAEILISRTRDYLGSKESLRRQSGTTSLSLARFEPMLDGERIIKKTTHVSGSHETRCEGGANAS